MTQIYHIFGSPIPHHNHTMLQFLLERLQPLLPQKAIAKCLLVGTGFKADYPALQIEEYASKGQIVWALVKIARQQPDVHFYLHGQFNFPLWLAMFVDFLPVERITWQMWGADLHQDSKAWKFRLAYPFRRMVQAKLKHIVGYQGDLNYFFREINPKVKGDLVYFPSKMDRQFQPPPKITQDRLCILLGNSGDPTNRHLDGLEKIHQQFGDKVKIIVPMGYPEHNQPYIQQVKQKADQLFPAPNGESAVQILSEKMPFPEYLALLNQCDVAYFLFHRQQGVGSLCLLIQFNVPVVLHHKNTFIADMQLFNVPFLREDQVSLENIEKTRQKLTALDKEKVGFLDPHFVPAWVELLTQILEGKR